MSQAERKKFGRIAESSEHVGNSITTNAKGEQSDLSGQLSHVLVGHPRHGGRSHEEAEKQIASERDSSPALNKALPIIADSSADRGDYDVRTSGTLDGKPPVRKPLA